MHLFNRVKFRTPESVELEFNLAGIGNRAWALVIDYHVLAVILILFFVLWRIISIQLAGFFPAGSSGRVNFWYLAIALLITFAIYTNYFVFFETLWQGQTPGKRFAKIRVVCDDGRPIGLQQATLRALLRPLDEILFLGVFLIIFSPKEKRLGDLAAGTIVIENQTRAVSTTFIASEQAKSVCNQLLSVANLSAMLPDDFAVIHEYFLRRSTMTRKARASVALKLAQQLIAIISLEKIPEGINPETFLEAVYLAYQINYEL